MENKSYIDVKKFLGSGVPSDRDIQEQRLILQFLAKNRDKIKELLYHNK